jgi:hypothetical protein
MRHAMLAPGRPVAHQSALVMPITSRGMVPNRKKGEL